MKMNCSLQQVQSKSSDPRKTTASSSVGATERNPGDRSELGGDSEVTQCTENTESNEKKDGVCG